MIAILFFVTNGNPVQIYISFSWANKSLCLLSI